MLKTLMITAFSFAFLGFSTIQSWAQIGGPPSITVPPVGISVSSGGSAQLTATVIDATKGVQWLFNNGTVPNNCSVSTLNVLGVGTVSTLTISGASSTAAGSYTIKASNSYLSVTSAPAVLLVVPITTVVSNVVNFVSSSTGKLASGAFKLTLSVPTGSNVVVEATSDLVGWTPISTNTATSSSLSITDSAAATISCRFYRARIQ